MSAQIQPKPPTTAKVATVDMTQGQFKELAVFAVVGAGFHSLEFARWAEEQGFATSTGDQHNESFEWVPEKLGALTIESLLSIFREIRGYNQPKKVH